MEKKKREVRWGPLVSSLLLLITITLAWYGEGSSYSGGSMEYGKSLALPNSSISLTNYYAQEQANGTIEYVPIDPEAGITVTGLGPGGRQIFMTRVVNNSKLYLANITLYLSSITLDAELNGYVAVGTIQPTGDNYYRITSTTPVDSNDPTKYFFSGTELVRDVKIGAGESIDLFWYVYMETDLENEGMQKSVFIENVLLSGA